MSNKIIIKHRQKGGAGAGAPPTAGAVSGELGINFDVAGTATPELWAFTTGGWQRLNPAATAPTIGNAALPGGTAGSSTGIGAAWTALTPKPTDPIIIASFGGSAYIKTGAGAADGDWTSLGSATSFATKADIVTGTDTAKSINSAALRGAALNAPTATPANDANYLIRLTSAGKIDAGFLSIAPVKYIGNIDPSAGAPPVTSPSAGSFGTVNIAGNTAAGTAPIAAWQAVIDSGAAKLLNGDLLIWDGTKYHTVAMNVDLAAYLPLVGGTMTNTAVVTFTASTAPLVRLDGSDALKSSIDNFSLDCGQF